MSNFTSSPTCATCAHYQPLQGGQGACRRYPPTACVVLVPQQQIMTAEVGFAPQNFTTWPTVTVGQGCGEHLAARGSVLAS